MNDLSSILERVRARVALAAQNTQANKDGIILNAAQKEFVTRAALKESLVLIGAAGTGKTTCQKQAMQKLLQTQHIPIIQSTDHRYLQAGNPGIILTSFTRRAVRNIRNNVSDELKQNCITIHKLLEYAPEFYEEYDATKDAYVNKMRFAPKRNEYNKLPWEIKTIVIEESSMVGTDLFMKLLAALPDVENTQFIFLGDIQQLPPVFGPAVLGFKMLSLPTIELTQVYRQALESPIIRLAHHLLSGQPINREDLPEWEVPNKLKLHPWKKKLHPDTALATAAKFFTSALDSGAYDPEEDMILMPFNKGCGTIELNKHIAQHLAKKAGQPVYEIIAGFGPVYFAVGDKVLHDKEDAVITKIVRNGAYTGRRPQKESLTLDYWGCNQGPEGTEYTVDSEEDIDAFLEAAAGSTSSEDRVNKASHIITVRMLDTDEECNLESAGEINALIHSFALTTHKAQGSEWDKVFIVTHISHNILLSREWWYTAITRAKNSLYIIMEPDALSNHMPRIPGDTWEEKAEHFKGRLSEGFIFEG